MGAQCHLLAQFPREAGRWELIRLRFMPMKVCARCHTCSQCGQDECCSVCCLSIYPGLRSTRKHVSASRLARGGMEAALQLSYLFLWQSRSGKLIKLIMGTSKHQEQAREEQASSRCIPSRARLVLMGSARPVEGSWSGDGGPGEIEHETSQAGLSAGLRCLWTAIKSSEAMGHPSLRVPLENKLRPWRRLGSAAGEPD